MNLQIQPLAVPFTVCRLASHDAVPLGERFVFTALTDEECSLVCPTALVPPETLEREDGWRAMRICGSLDFSLVGILSSLTSSLAAQGIPVFAISTFRTDYLLVKEAHFRTALALFEGAGHEILPSQEV